MKIKIFKFKVLKEKRVNELVGSNPSRPIFFYQEEKTNLRSSHFFNGSNFTGQKRIELVRRPIFGTPV